MTSGHISFQQRLTRWLQGLGHSRGFGIQSPSDYGFVREVVAEQWPYHLYADLRRAFPDVPRSRRKLLELYLRLSNHVQPKVVKMADDDAVVAAYLQAGCRKAQMLGSDDAAEAFDLLWIPAQGCTPELADRFLKEARPGAAIVVEGIWRSPKAQATWQQFCAATCSTVCFDLLRCGIAFLAPKRHKCLYRVNF